MWNTILKGASALGGTKSFCPIGAVRIEPISTVQSQILGRIWEKGILANYLGNVQIPEWCPISIFQAQVNPL